MALLMARNNGHNDPQMHIDSWNSNLIQSVPVKTVFTQQLTLGQNLESKEERRCKFHKLSSFGSQERKSDNMHPCVGTKKMRDQDYISWSLSKIQLLAAELAAIEDKKGAQYKKI